MISMCGPEAPPNRNNSPASVSMEPGTEQPPVAKQDAHELFTSDEFRVFCFKVLPCSKRFVHDWPSCPFAHPGEKAKRRDPRTHQYDCEMCPAVLKGEVCELGAACPHSHHVFESWLHPQKYRTLLCKDGDQCHREVCFFAHGSKQLRTPERSHQQRISQQQRYSPMAESAHKLQAAVRSSSANSSYHSGRQGGHQQQGACANGVAMANGSPSNSASTNISAAALAQLQGQGMSACTTPYAAGDAALLQQQQQALLGNQVDGSMHVQLQAALMGANGPTGGDVSQLLHSLAAEASASKHEAAEHSRAAALAQQKLQLLEQLLGCNGAAFAPAAGAGQGFGTPMTSPVATKGWQMAPGAGQQLPLSGPQLTQLLHMQQQMAAHAALEGPRRHSLDESLLRRVRNMQQNLPASSLSRGTSLWSATPSAALSSVTEGAVLGMPSRSAATDIDALAAAFSAAGLPVDGQAALLNSMQGAGMPSGSSVLSPAASAAMAAAQLGGPSNGSWMVQQGADPTWGQGMGLSGGMAQFGAFHSGSQLPSIPFSGAALLNGNGSISAPQLQSDYLLQLHAALQANGIAAPEAQRASFDVAATYLPPLPGELLVGRNATTEMLAAGADDVAGGSNSSAMSSSGCSNAQDPPAVPAVSDKLAGNPIGGAGQLGWF